MPFKMGLKRREAARDYFAMAANRGNYTFEQWQKESDRLLKKAVGRKWGIFKTREEKALGEFMRLARNEKLKTREMQERSLLESMFAHPRVSSMNEDAIRDLLGTHLGEGTVTQIQNDSPFPDKGTITIAYRKRDGTFDRRVIAKDSRLGEQYAKLLGSQKVLSAQQLGLKDQISLKSYIENKYKLKWDKRLEQKLAGMSSLIPAYGAP